MFRHVSGMLDRWHHVPDTGSCKGVQLLRHMSGCALTCGGFPWWVVWVTCGWGEFWQCKTLLSAQGIDFIVGPGVWAVVGQPPGTMEVQLGGEQGDITPGVRGE